MSENTNEHPNQALIDSPHGLQEGIKIKLLDMIQQASDPFDIIYVLADYLERASAERGYARHIIDNIHTIYGISLQKEKPLQDEIVDLTARVQRIEAALAAAEKNPDSSEEEQARMNFAIKAHHRKIQQLQQLIAASK